MECLGLDPRRTIYVKRSFNGTHNEARWAKRVQPALRFLSPAR
jgi:hypothetical protein